MPIVQKSITISIKQGNPPEDMYEPSTEKPSLRPAFRITLWVLAALVVVWLLLWLIFFRHPYATVPTAKTMQGQHSQKTPSSNESDMSKNPSSNTNTTPAELANTGAGSILVPFLVATILGSSFYYVHLRKRLTV